MEPVYAQFVDPIEMLEVVVEWLEVSRGRVPVGVDVEVASVRQQPVGGDHW